MMVDIFGYLRPRAKKLSHTPNERIWSVISGAPDSIELHTTQHASLRTFILSAFRLCITVVKQPLLKRVRTCSLDPAATLDRKKQVAVRTTVLRLLSKWSQTCKTFASRRALSKLRNKALSLKNNLSLRIIPSTDVVQGLKSGHLYIRVIYSQYMNQYRNQPCRKYWVNKPMGAAQI